MRVNIARISAVALVRARQKAWMAETRVYPPFPGASACGIPASRPLSVLDLFFLSRKPQRSTHGKLGVEFPSKCFFSSRDVAISRGRYDAQIYTNSRAELGERLSRVHDVL